MCEVLPPLENLSHTSGWTAMTCGTSTESFWDMHTCNHAYEYTQILQSHAHTKIYSGMHTQAGPQGITITSVFSRQWNKEFLGHSLRTVKTIRHNLRILSWLLDMLCIYVLIFIWSGHKPNCTQVGPTGICLLDRMWKRVCISAYVIAPSICDQIK